MALKFDFDEALRNLIQQVDEKLQATYSKNEPLTDWLLAFPAKAKQKLVSNEGFKMPKTPGRKKAVRQQKKRVLNEGDANQETSNDIPQNKRGKLFHEEEDLLRESVEGGRPRRQASNAAKSKIQKSLKMMNLTQKLRRPAGEEASGEEHNTSTNQPPTIEEESSSPVLPKVRQSVRNQQESVSTSTTIPDDQAPPETVNNSKVQFAPEPQWREPESDEAVEEPPKEIEAEVVPPPPVEEVVQVEPPKKGRTRKIKVPEAASTSEVPEEQPAETTSRTRKAKKTPEVVDVEPVVHEKPCPASRKTKKSDVVPEVVSPSISQKQKKSKESHSNEKESVTPDKEEENKAPISEEPEVQPAAEPAATRTRKTKKVPEVVEVDEVVREKPCPASRKTKKSDEDVVSPSSSQMKKRSKESYSNEKETIGLPEEPSHVPTATKKASVEPVKDVAVRASLRRKISTEIVDTSEVQVVQEAPAPETNGAIPKKVTSKVKKPVKEPKSSAAMPPPVASPRATRLSKAVREPPVTPSRRNLLEQASKFTSPTSSPARKPFLVFSPFKPSSVKTKVEAFEAVLSSGGGARETRQSKAQSTVLPEAQVLLRRLTSDDLSDAGIVPESPEMEVTESGNANDGTFIVDEPTKQVDKRQSISQALARKSIGKAKLTAISAARNKLANSVVQTDAAESPNVHLNRNAANLMSKFRFNTGGSSGSSSASSARHVAMTQARTLGNVVTGVTSFTATNKPMQPLVTKSSDDEGQKRKEIELRRLKEKEEEAARKREEILKAKAEEQKKKHDARIKRAMEQRALKAKQADEEQKQKLENKEEKAAHLKMKLQVETQEKAERKRAEILQRQQEAEQRRKAEELQKQKEEEQQRLLKKEQEELEKQVKVKIENEKTKTGAAAGPSNLNTTVTLTKPEELIDTYQITPVRVKKTTGKKVPNPDNYDINDMRSDDSTDDDSKPKKVIPLWARSVNVKAALANQIYNDISDTIFPAEILLLDPDLNVIFKHKRPRFDKRTSSAVWKTPPAHYM